MDNDDLFDIIEPSEEQKDNTSDSEGDFVQDDSFVNSLDFVNGFSDATDSEIDKLLDEAGDIVNGNTEEVTDADIDGLIDELDIPDSSDVSVADKTINDDLISNDSTSVTSNTGDNDIQDINMVDENSEIVSSDETTSENENDLEDDENLDDFDDEDFEQIMMITEGTSITGSITTDCSLDVFGTVNGDIFCDGKLSISGKVIGNSHAAEVMINAHRVEGNIECNGVVKIGQGSVIIGDISAGAAVIAGAVKGTLDVKGPVILDSTAVIKGNIKAKSVQLINGAVLEGFCSLEYANSDVDSIFN